MKKDDTYVLKETLYTLMKEGKTKEDILDALQKVVRKQHYITRR
ncbi:hypothetical protein [Alteribacter salitolerans]|nr:hypothetical protein [Alteribacter salitolerans]